MSFLNIGPISDIICLLLTDLTRDDLPQPALKRFDWAAVVFRPQNAEEGREEAESEDDGEENGGEQEGAKLHEEWYYCKQHEGGSTEGRARSRQHRDPDLSERIVKTSKPFAVRRPAVSLRQMHDIVHGQTDDQGEVEGLQNLSNTTRGKTGIVGAFVFCVACTSM